MIKSDYHQHDAQYGYLRKSGFLGWGAEHYDRRMQGWRATIEALLLAEVFPKKGAPILELGTGAGDSLMVFAEHGYDVFGIDISRTALEWAQEKFNNKKLKGHFSLGDISRSLPYVDSSFSAVLDAACLHCLLEEDLIKVLSEIRRVLKPRGFLLISHMVNNPREMMPGIVFNIESRTQERNGTMYRHMPTIEQLMKNIKSVGFEIIQTSLRQNPWWDHAELWCAKI